MASVERSASDLERLTITPSGETVTKEEAPKAMEAAKVPKVEWAKYSRRIMLSKILGRPDGGVGLIGETLVVGGWVKTAREQGKSSMTFLEVSDSSCSPNVQGRVPLCLRSLVRLISTNQQQQQASEVGAESKLNGASPSATAAATASTVKVEVNPVRTIAGTAIILLNDGSNTSSLQVVVDSNVITPLSQVTAMGTCLLVQGVLRKPQVASSKHMVELKVDKILQLGACDNAKYPISKARLPLAFLRNYIHLRPRTNTFSAVARLRNALAFATHTFFQNHGFLYVHTPVITTAPVTQGTTEAFQVTTLFGEADRQVRASAANGNNNTNTNTNTNTNKQHHYPSAADIEDTRAALKEKTERVMKMRRTNSNRATVDTAIEDMEKTKALLAQLQHNFKANGNPVGVGRVDYSRDFFSRQAYLTVSGQFHVEAYACALTSVYTFGPTFRAQPSLSHSATSQHLAEYWLVEPEIAFAELEDDMNCAEDYLKFLCQWLLQNCKDDMKFMSNQFDKNVIQRLQHVVSTPFHRITYSEAMDILCQDESKFKTKPQRGMELSTEHERYLTEQFFKKPVIVYNYPKEMKSFYVRLNDDNATVAAMDVLVPKIGGLMSGSQREERYDVIEKRLKDLGLPTEPYEWYLELRKYGTVKHSGFGMAFEVMVLFVTGLENIQDAIPFPRVRGQANP